MLYVKIAMNGEQVRNSVDKARMRSRVSYNRMAWASKEQVENS
jgi:hypothetical protein